jgi:hypothetical protein
LLESLEIALPADDPLLVNWVYNILISLEGSGDLQRLTEHWFNDASWMESLP